MGVRKKTKTRPNRRRREPIASRVKKKVLGAARFILVMVAVPAAAYGGWLGYRAVTTAETFAVESVEVTGTTRATADEVIAYTALAFDGDSAADPAGLRGRNIYSFSRKAVEDAVSEHPWVVEARLRRRLPDRVVIEVAEREPMVLVMMDGLYVMDTTGTVFKRYDESEALDLPVVTGLDQEGDGELLPEDRLLALISILRARSGFNLDSVSELNIDPVYGLTVYTLAEGVRLDLGFSRFAEKLDSFEKVLQARGGSLAGITAMDLTNSREVVVTFATNVRREGGVI